MCEPPLEVCLHHALACPWSTFAQLSLEVSLALQGWGFSLPPATTPSRCLTQIWLGGEGGTLPWELGAVGGSLGCSADRLLLWETSFSSQSGMNGIRWVAGLGRMNSGRPLG